MRYWPKFKCFVVTPRVQVVLQKTNSGFGFTVKGSCPVAVGHVKPDSAAERAGLQTGDYIRRVNGLNVSRSSSKSVADIVRYVSPVVQ